MFNWFKYLNPYVKKEKALIITEDYEITGWLYSMGPAKNNRFLSNLLNSANKNFIAITNCEVVHKNRQGELEHMDFLQLNMRYIILIKPLKEDSEENQNLSA